MIPTLTEISGFLTAHWKFILAGWFALFIFGTLILYIGFGFVMSALNAKQKGKSQEVIYYIDAVISIGFALLDILLNIVVYSFVCLDFRPKYVFTTLSFRLSYYNVDEKERQFRRVISGLFGAALDGKDPSEDHITGPNMFFKWLGKT